MERKFDDHESMKHRLTFDYFCLSSAYPLASSIFSDSPCGVFQVSTVAVLFKIFDIDVADAENAHVGTSGLCFEHFMEQSTLFDSGFVVIGNGKVLQMFLQPVKKCCFFFCFLFADGIQEFI